VWGKSEKWNDLNGLRKRRDSKELWKSVEKPSFGTGQESVFARENKRRARFIVPVQKKCVIRI
jgi:hypothetical protein